MYNKIVWSYNKPKVFDVDTLYLGLNDINHLERIYTKYNLTPESFDEVRIDFLADKHNLIRYIIKELDILLKVDGKFIINSTYTEVHGNFIRSKSQIGYEFSVSINGRYFLSNKKVNKYKLTLEYIKKQKTLHHDDSIDKWSFGIITNGKKNEQVQKLISSIITQNIPNYEIIICGSFKYENKEKFPIISIDDVLLDDEIRAPITIKKNKIADVAQYQNLMILHDRYLLPDDWYQKMKNYGNYFDLLTMPNIGPNGGNVNDWGEHLGKPSQIYREVFHLLSHKKWSNGWYSQGGLLIIKKELYNQNRLDERLFWGELEDIQFSQIGNLLGWFYYIDINNKVITFTDRLYESSLNERLNLLHRVKAYKNYYLNKFKNVLKHFKNINE